MHKIFVNLIRRLFLDYFKPSDQLNSQEMYFHFIEVDICCLFSLVFHVPYHNVYNTLYID